MAHKQHPFIPDKLDNPLDAGIFVPASAFWSLSVAIAPSKNGKVKCHVGSRCVNQATKADHWPLLRVEKLIDDFCVSKLCTPPDLSSWYWKVSKTNFMEGNRSSLFALLSLLVRRHAFWYKEWANYLSTHDGCRYPTPNLCRSSHR